MNLAWQQTCQEKHLTHNSSLATPTERTHLFRRFLLAAPKVCHSAWRHMLYMKQDAGHGFMIGHKRLSSVIISKQAS